MRRAAARLLLAAILTAAMPAAAARPALRGVVEGYYGRPWSHAARRDVIRSLAGRRLDTFVYGPKNDVWHRDRWREPYPAAELAALRETARVARRAGVRFVWAVSPVLDVCYACPADRDALLRKLAQVARAGVRHFALFLDDGGALTAPEDRARYGGTDPTALARAQADLANHVRRWLRRRRLPARPLVVPSDYYGTECRPYHAVLDRALARGVPVGWTGPAVLSARITAADARARAACLPRHPVVLWDNYPVNDALLSNTVHLGPLVGRDPALPRQLDGYLANPMTQPYASLLPLATVAEYLRAPDAYDPEAAWQRALDDAEPDAPGVSRLAQQVRSSFLDLDDARELRDAVHAVEVAHAGPDWEPSVSVLAAAAAMDATAAASLSAAGGDAPLAAELAPWAAEMAAHAAGAADAVRLLRALKPALAVTAEPAGPAMLRVHGTAAPPDTPAALALGPVFTAAADAADARVAMAPLGPYAACLGPFLSADIRFCPQFGLNVHGKAFYVAFTDRIEIVTDRSVYDRMLRVARTRYGAWLATRYPDADELTVTVAGVPAVLGPDGAFDTTVAAPEGAVRVLVETAAGAATARLVP